MALKPVEWTLRQGKKREDFVVDSKAVMSTEAANVMIERVETAPGVVASLADVTCREDFTLKAGVPSEGLKICTQTTFAGQCSFEVDQGVNTVYRPDRSLGYCLPETQATFRVAAGQSVKTVAFAFSLDAFEERLSEHAPENFRSFLTDNPETGRLTEIPSSRLQHRIAETVFCEPLTGSLRRMQFDGFATMLMARMLAGVEGMATPRPQELRRSVRDRLHDIRDRLLADPVNLPALDELAREAMLDRKRLNMEFRKLFGATVFEFSRNHRLDLARARLHDTQAGLKEIAHEAGYAHLSNFVAAYTRRFGMPPGRARGAPSG